MPPGSLPRMRHHHAPHFSARCPPARAGPPCPTPPPIPARRWPLRALPARRVQAPTPLLHSHDVVRAQPHPPRRKTPLRPPHGALHPGLQRPCR
eukprot:scaffold4328_cov135-Isochrysis_galbana.AAC.16